MNAIKFHIMLYSLVTYIVLACSCGVSVDTKEVSTGEVQLDSIPVYGIYTLSRERREYDRLRIKFDPYYRSQSPTAYKTPQELLAVFMHASSDKHVKDLYSNSEFAPKMTFATRKERASSSFYTDNFFLIDYISEYQDVNNLNYEVVFFEIHRSGVIDKKFIITELQGDRRYISLNTVGPVIKDRFTDFSLRVNRDVLNKMFVDHASLSAEAKRVLAKAYSGEEAKSINLLIDYLYSNKCTPEEKSIFINTATQVTPGKFW